MLEACRGLFRVPRERHQQCFGAAEIRPPVQRKVPLSKLGYRDPSVTPLSEEEARPRQRCSGSRLRILCALPACPVLPPRELRTSPLEGRQRRCRSLKSSNRAPVPKGSRLLRRGPLPSGEDDGFPLTPEVEQRKRLRADRPGEQLDVVEPLGEDEGRLGPFERTFVRPGLLCTQANSQASFALTRSSPSSPTTWKARSHRSICIGEATRKLEDVGQSDGGVADCIRITGCLVVGDGLLGESDRPVVGGREFCGRHWRARAGGTLGAGGGHLQRLLEKGQGLFGGTEREGTSAGTSEPVPGSRGDEIGPGSFS